MLSSTMIVDRGNTCISEPEMGQDKRNETHNDNSSAPIKESKQMAYMVADTAVFIKNVPMYEFADHVVTIHDVVDEIRDKETKQRLLACPLDIQYMEPDTDSIIKGM